MNTKEQASAKKGQGDMKAATAKKPQTKSTNCQCFCRRRPDAGGETPWAPVLMRSSVKQSCRNLR